MVDGGNNSVMESFFARLHKKNIEVKNVVITPAKRTLRVGINLGRRFQVLLIQMF